MRTFTVADQETLLSRVQSATKRVVYVAPGLFEELADLLIDRIANNFLNELKVIVDVDDEVCRLGYGDIQALRKLKNAADSYGFMLCHQPGLRLGVLLTDDDILIWSPVPLAVEDESHKAQSPNALDIKTGSLDALEDALGSAASTVEANLLNQEIGLDPLPEERLRKTEDSLEKIPPKKFELARQERVFSSKLEFVEMKLKDYKLSKKIMPISGKLMALSKDKKIRARWRNWFTLFESHEFKVEIEYLGKNVMVDEAFLDKERDRLDSDYLTNIKGYGKVIPLKIKKDFQKEIEVFENLLTIYADNVLEMVKQQLKQEMQQLEDDLLPRFLENPPTDFKKTLLFDETDEESAHCYIAGELNRSLGMIKKHITPKLSVIYKGITYETFKTDDFVNELNEKFGEGALQRILDEYDAAREA